jgi:hypothetical protein
VAERAGITSENFTFADVLTLQDDIRELTAERDREKLNAALAEIGDGEAERLRARVAELEAENERLVRYVLRLPAVRQEGT